MSETIGNPIGESLYFAYIQAIMKKQNCTQEEAQKIAQEMIFSKEGNDEQD
jgi:hypothetical protein